MNWKGHQMTVKLLKNERIDQLFSEDIKVIQSKEVFSYSIDSILLAKFPKLPKKNGKILDLCAGNGAVGLFASRYTPLPIIQVEIQSRLADMGKRSILLNKLEDQIIMLNEDLLHIENIIEKNSFTHILCNPPYFKYSEESRKNPNLHLAMARHEITATLDDIVRISSKFLKTKGYLAMVHRPERFLEILDILRNYQIAPKRIQFIHPKAGKESNTLLIEGIKNGSEEGLKILPPLIVHNKTGGYSKEIQEAYYGGE
jgi:tRNA1(Val) A37 N6-methylase TrmN6